MKASSRFVAVILLALGMGIVACVESVQAATVPAFPLADRILARIGTLHDRLDLTPEQQAIWAQALAATRNTFSARQPQLTVLKDDANRLLAASSVSGTDIRRFLDRVDAERESGRPQRQALREQWVRIYEKLTPVQQAIARNYVKGELDRLQTMRERLAFFRR